MAKVIDSTNVGRLVSDIKAKADSTYWHTDDTVEVSLATVATTGSYNDLTDKPTAASGALIYMGTCGTAAGTAAKVVTVETFPLQNSLPIVGTTIGVKFTNSNTANTPTLDVNGIGAKSIWYNASAVSSTSVTYGGSAGRYVYYVWDGTYWVWLNHGTEANDNSLGYTIRTNATRKTVSGACYRYRILFTSADGTKWVPSNTSTSTSATSSKTVNQTKIDPFGPIAYYSNTTALSSGGAPGASYLFQQYASLTLGYSFNRTGAALVLTTQTPVYIKCAPQTDGSAIIDSDTPYVQALPSTADGKIYILLGNAIAATTVELLYCHPVYYYADSAIRLWTNAAASSGGITDVTLDGTSVVSGGVAALPAYPTVPVTDVTVGGTSVVSSGTAVIPDIPSAPGTLNTTATTAQSTAASEALSGSVTLHKVAKTGTYSDLIGTPTIPSAPGTLITNATTTQTASAGEAMSGSITLHKISKTGSYDDLLNKPTIPAAGIPSGGTTGQVLKKTSGTDYAVEWANESGAVTDVTVGGSSVVSNGVAAVPAIPTISTDLYTDRASNVKASSPKSIYDTIFPGVGSSQPAGGMLPNVYYDLGTLTGAVTIAFAVPIDSNTENEYKFIFTAGSTAPTITWPNSITVWAGNCLDSTTLLPIIAAGNRYEVSVVDGVAIIVEFV